MEANIREFLEDLDSNKLEELMDLHSANRLTAGMDLQEVVIQLNHGSMLFTLDILNLYHDWLMQKMNTLQIK